MNDTFKRYIKEKIRVIDMPNEDMRFIAETCGVETALKIMENLSGARFFVPIYWQKHIATRFVAENAGILSVKELAVATGMSDWTVNQILNKKQSEIDEMSQMTICD